MNLLFAAVRMSYAHNPAFWSHAHEPGAWPPEEGSARASGQGAGGKAPRDRQNANHTSLLTYFGPLSDPNRDRFDNENAVSVTKITSSLPFVQVRRGATSGNYRGT